jgi:opacity protein-like surface antigen
MRKLLCLLAMTGAVAVAPFATSSAAAAVEVSVGPFKVKGYTGLMTLEDANNRRADATLVLRRAGAGFEQKHTFTPKQTVRIKHNHALTRGSVTGRFGKLGRVKLTFTSSQKENGPVGEAPGCEGDRGMGRKGVFRGRFLLKTGERYFKKLDIRRTKGAMYLPESDICSYSEERENNAFARFGFGEDFPAGRNFELLAADFDSDPNQVLELSLNGGGPLLLRHELLLFNPDHSMFRFEDAPHARIVGSGQFLSGTATFTPENPNCRSFVEGTVQGDLRVKFDSPGPIQPFAKARSGTFSSPAPTTGC